MASSRDDHKIKKDASGGANQNISTRLYHKGKKNAKYTRNYKSRRG
jgi:hypothetical protein